MDETFNIPYREQKIENAIAFFVHEYNRITKKCIRQTFLYKFLAFLDFESVKETGEPALGLTYDAMDRGPVPEELYKEREFLQSDMYTSSMDGAQLIFKASVKKPDLDYFSKWEIDEMNRLIEIYAASYVKTGDISDASHESIMAWKRTYRTNKNGKIPYSAEFPGDIYARKKPTPAEEHFLITHALKASLCK